MTAVTAVHAEVAIFAALLLALLTVAVWHLRPLKDVGRRDAGLDLFVEDRTEDELEALYELPAWQRDGAE